MQKWEINCGSLLCRKNESMCIIV